MGSDLVSVVGIQGIQAFDGQIPRVPFCHCDNGN
jgi:hypothetical protein